ncbi:MULTISPECIES: hypothetical protein [Leucobacter]|nr:hypothetical protein [Leucobacter chironomi]
MVFGKALLVIVIVVTILLALFLRVRAWRARRAQERAVWQAELDRDLRGD